MDKNAAVLEKIMRKQREKQDDGPRTDRANAEFIQTKLRAFDASFDESSGTSDSSTSEGGRGIEEPEGSQGVTRGDHFGYPHTNGSNDENNGSLNQTERGLRGEDRATQSIEPVDGKAKPGGLNALPSKRERRIRQSEEEKRLKKNAYMRERRHRLLSAQADQAPEIDQAPAAAVKPRSIIDAIKPKVAAEKPIRKPLSEGEANKLRPQLIAALMDFFEYADQAIYATNKKKKRVQIWSTVDEEEAGILVDAWLARAKISAVAAAQVTALVEAHRKLKVGLILIPRFYATFQVYLENGFGLK